MKHFTIALSLLMLTLAVSAAEPKRVLFVGNSYTEVNNLPQLVKQVAKSAGHDIEYRSNTPGGCTFRQHCTNMSMDYICQGGWDVVVLQEQSQYPSFPQWQVEADVFPYARALVDSVYAHSPEGEAMFYMTWGRRDGDQGNAQAFPVLGTYEGMDSMLYERYMQMGRDNDASVCPVGRVWRRIRTLRPDIELYSGDGSHPSMTGSYVAACAFYTMIFEASPMETAFVPAEVDSAVASTVREMVRTVVFDSLSFWKRPSWHPDEPEGIPAATAPRLAVGPNPSHGVVTLTADGDDEVSVYNCLGQLVKKMSVTAGSTTVDLSSCARGLVLLRSQKHGEIKLIVE